MNELDLLKRIYEHSTDLPSFVKVGPGDDAAVVEVGGRRLLLTVDQLIGGRHFEVDRTASHEIAHKAIGRSVSDIAAMGGKPLFSLATGALPTEYEQGAELFDAMAERARAWGCPLVGGDIASGPGPLALTVTVIGEVCESRGPVLRSEARAGDGVYVTGALGGSLLSGRHKSFEPRVAEGAWLSATLGDRLGAMIDLSDGPGLDSARIAEASRVKIVFESEALPLHPETNGWRGACADGEDYELLFTARGDVPARCEVTGTSVTRIGEVMAGAGAHVQDADGQLIDVSRLGWSHGTS